MWVFRRVSLAVLACVAGHTGASATTTTVTTSFSVSIVIVKACSVSTPAAIAFAPAGAYDLLSTTATASTTFTILCTPGANYTIGFAGLNDAPANSSTHTLKGTNPNTDTISYQLTDTTGGATNVTPLSATGSLISGSGTGVAVSKTIQAKIINYSAAVAPDTYTDTVTLSVTY